MKFWIELAATAKADIREAAQWRRDEVSAAAEILDIDQIVDRWEEIMDRRKAGEMVAITIHGEPKARLESIHRSDHLRSGESVTFANPKTQLFAYLAI